MEHHNQLTLLCGLPGAGKTTLAAQIVRYRPDIEWIDADVIRKQADDWDFTAAGRLRQTIRLREAARHFTRAKCVLVSQVCPTVELRNEMGWDRMIWMNTISRAKCRFPDTAALWEDPVPEEIMRPGYLEILSYVPNDSILNLMNTFAPPYRTNGAAFGAFLRAQEMERERLINLLNPEGAEDL